VIEVDPTSPIARIVFLSSTGEQILPQELEVPTKEEEEETYIKSLIEEREESEGKLYNPVVEPNIYSEVSIMAEEGEGEIHNVNSEQHRIGGGGGGNTGGGKGCGRGRGRGNLEPFGFPIIDEDYNINNEKHPTLYSP